MLRFRPERPREIIFIGNAAQGFEDARADARVGHQVLADDGDDALAVDELDVSAIACSRFCSSSMSCFSSIVTVTETSDVAMRSTEMLELLEDREETRQEAVRAEHLVRRHVHHR